jgi:hypothetical protein
VAGNYKLHCFGVFFPRKTKLLNLTVVCWVKFTKLECWI